MIQTLHKEIHKWPISTGKVAQHLQSSAKCKSTIKYKFLLTGMTKMKGLPIPRVVVEDMEELELFYSASGHIKH